MKPLIAGVLAEAGALWRSEQELLLRIAAVFVFLPQLAGVLFFPLPDITGLDQQAALDAVRPWLATAWPWLGGAILAQVFGQMAMLMLLLDSRKPSVGEAMVSALSLLPGAALISLAINAAQAAGLIAFIFPAIYVMGRAFLILPSIAAAPARGLGSGIIEGIRHTNRRGWLIGLLPFSIFAGTYVIATLIGALLPAGTAVTAPAAIAAGAVASVVAALSVTAQVLLQAAAYRVLVPRHGM